jgi:hypothetical protein
VFGDWLNRRIRAEWYLERLLYVVLQRLHKRVTDRFAEDLARHSFRGDR